MADEAAARSLERDGARLRLHVVAGDAGVSCGCCAKRAGWCTWWIGVPRRGSSMGASPLPCGDGGTTSSGQVCCSPACRRKWRLPTLCRTGLGALVATDAVRHPPRGMRRVTGLAARRHLRCALPSWKSTFPVRMTACVSAGLEGVLRLHVLMGIVAHAAGAAVRIALGIEVGQAFPHGVTGEALLRSRHERTLGRVKRREPRHHARELVAHHAMQARLLRHRAQPDIHVLREVADLLRTGAVDRREAMGGAGVTGETLHLPLECRAVRLSGYGGRRSWRWPARFSSPPLLVALFARCAARCRASGWSSREHQTSTAPSSPLPCGH